MRPFALAVLVLAGALAWARADDGAYDSLLAMADAARSDRGPDAGPLPPADARREPAQASRPKPAREPRPAAAGEDLRDAVAAAPAPRASQKLWTRVYSTLAPSWRSAPVLAPGTVARSTAAAVAPPARPSLPPSDSEAVKAGEVRGLVELMSTSAAPADVR